MPKVKPLIYSPTAEVKTLRQNIQIALVKRGMNQTDLADALGVTKSSVSWMITHADRMRFETICRIAHILKVDKAELMKEVM